MRKINKEFAEVMMTKPEGRMIEQLTVSNYPLDSMVDPLSLSVGTDSMYMFTVYMYYNIVTIARLCVCVCVCVCVRV